MMLHESRNELAARHENFVRSRRIAMAVDDAKGSEWYREGIRRPRLVARCLFSSIQVLLFPVASSLFPSSFTPYRRSLPWVVLGPHGLGAGRRP